MKMTSFIEDILRCIERKDPTDKIRKILNICPKSDILKWRNSEKMDMLHFCIIGNYPEAIELFLKQGFFTETHKPEVKPYLHLAAKLGHRTVINLLMTYRLSDNHPISTSALGADLTNKTSSDKELTPLDVAAQEGYLPCVELILNLDTVKAHPEFAKSSYVALATLAGSSLAVKLILKTKQKDQYLLEAVQIAVNTANADCLALLLDTEIKTKNLFNGNNLYHALYSLGSASTFGKQGYARIPEVTKVLAKRNHDVNVKDPTNTYPLYSLIRNSICVHNYVWSQYYLESMKVLMKNGADPNFDELAYERTLKKKGRKSIAGRPAYSSAFHCLLDTVEMFVDAFDSKALAAKFIMECVNIICKEYNTPSETRKAGIESSSLSASVLHQFAKSSVTLGVDVTIFKYLLRQGADINSKVQGKYFLNVYIDTLFEALKGKSLGIKMQDVVSDLELMLELSKMMTHNAIVRTHIIFKKDHSASKTASQTSKLCKMIDDSLTLSIQKVKSLHRITSDYIWLLCNRRANTVHQLPIAVKYKTEILPI